LAVAFALAVICPNEIGTHCLPAVGCKAIARASDAAADSPPIDRHVTGLVSIELHGKVVLARGESAIWMFVPTSRSVQLNLPLLI
jgi:hypothetical protein